ARSTYALDLVDGLRVLCLATSYSFFFTATATTEIYTLSLHDALPICNRAAIMMPPRFRRSIRIRRPRARCARRSVPMPDRSIARSEEHTSELQSRRDLVCRLLLEKKKK